MKRVAASEYDLLTVARALVGLIGPDAAAPILRQGRPVQERVGPTAMGLLQDVLAKGAVLSLTRRGGWREAEHLGQREPRPARLWERREPPALVFGPLTYELCRWLTSAQLGGGEPKRLRWDRSATLADQLALYLACDLAQRAGCGEAVAASSAFRRSPLAWLGFVDLLSVAGAPSAAELTASAWDALFKGEGGTTLLEALQADLARRWLEVEHGKARITSAQRLTELGVAQTAVLEGLTTAAEGAGRRDLAAFACEAAARLLRYRPSASCWVRGLVREGSLEERARACREGGAFLRSLERIHRWVEEARGVRFFDDDYAASQLLLRQWEPLGGAGYQHALQIVADLQAIDAPARLAEPAPAEVSP